MPVRLPPGWARLATRPVRTGSSERRNTMGMLAVAAFAGRAAGVFTAITVEPNPPRALVVDRTESQPTGTRLRRSRLRQSQSPLGPDGTRVGGPGMPQATRC